MQANETDDALAEILTLTREVDDWGTIRYRNSAGQLHRIHGPAMTLPDGSEIWLHTSRLHREGGPADTWPDGSEYWYHLGDRHRVDGPAVIYPDGDCQWWLNGQQLTEYEWRDQVAEMGTPPSDQIWWFPEKRQKTSIESMGYKGRKWVLTNHMAG